MNSSIISVSHVTKNFTTGTEVLTILDDLDFTIEKPGTFAVTGESGSGKSTFLNLVGGLDRPTSGEIIVGGNRIDHLVEDDLTRFRKETVGFIFQFHFLLKDFTAVENVMLAGYIAGMPRKEATRRAEELLEEVKLENRLEHYPGQLSGGEKQRVAVARALMNNPDIVLADEPTGNLDEKNSRNVEEVLFSLTRELDKTLILVTHDKKLAAEADVTYRLIHGKLIT